MRDTRDRDHFVQAVVLAVTKARAVHEDNRNATAIFISGASGPFADLVNGPYKPTQLKGPDGRIIYRKIGDDSMYIEHRSESENIRERKSRHGWSIKRVSKDAEGWDSSFAIVGGGCALECCTSRVWSVHLGTEFQSQPQVKMVAGAEAHQAVSNCICSLR